MIRIYPIKRKAFWTIIIIAIATALVSANVWAMPLEANTQLAKTDTNNSNRENALHILETKCNVCHKKQNPFMVFKKKNMDKRAFRINKMVFIEGRMPKGDEIKLTQEEYTLLKNWITSLNIY